MMTIEHTQRHVTVYDGGITQTTMPEYGPVHAIIEAVKSGRYRGPVNWIRECLENDDDDSAGEAKKQLPVICWSGRFNRRVAADCSEHTGLVVLDYDHLDDAEDLRDQVRDDPHAVAAFVSPSGEGLKVVVAMDATPTTHKSAWVAARSYYAQKYGVEADHSGSDVCRACFVSWDPDAWCKTAACLPFEPVDEVIESSGIEDLVPITQNRNVSLTSLGGMLRSRGLSQDALEAALLTENRLRCQPPLDDDEVVRIARNLGQYHPEADIMLGGDIAAGLLQVIDDGIEPPTELVFRTKEDRHTMPAMQWGVEGVLPVGGVGCIFAEAGVGKSLAGVELARCVITGEPFGSADVHVQGRCLFICTDSGRSVEDRLRGQDPVVDDGIVTIRECELPTHLAPLDDYLAANPDFALLVVDTWDSTRIHGGGGWAAEDAALEGTMRAIRGLCERHDLMGLITHHSTKDKDNPTARGSNVLRAKLDWEAHLVSLKDKRVRLKTTKSRDGDGEFCADWDVVANDLPDGRTVGGLKLSEGKVDTDDDMTRRVRQMAILGAIRDGNSTHRGIAAVSGVSRGSIGRILKQMEDEGLLTPDRGLTTEGLKMANASGLGAIFGGND